MQNSTSSLAALAAIVDISADAIIALDSNFRIIRFNRGAVDMFGWEEDEMLGQPLDRLLPMGVRAVHRGHVRTFAEGARDARRMADRQQISGLRRTGEQFPAEASIARVAVDGERTFMVTLRDISERRQAEERQRLLSTAGWVLAASLDVESTMATVAELPIPLFGDWSMLELLSPEGTLRRAAATHSDPMRQEMVSALVSRVPQLQPMEPPPASAGRIAHEAEAQRITDIGAWLSSNFPDAEDRARVEALGASSVMLVPLRASGRAIGALHIVRTRPGSVHVVEEAHVADQYAGLAALALENARLYHASRQAIRERDDMLAIVSHDLRNPVNAIVLLTGAALENDPDATALMDRDAVESVRAAARHVDGLIQDLQDVSRISAGRLRVDRRRVSIAEVVEEAARLFEPAAREAGVTMMQRIDENAPSLMADSGRLLQVLSNLLGNAVRFTPAEGIITLTLETGPKTVTIRVRDSGAGIAPEDIPRLFDRYWQAPRLLRAGSGLGLYIAKGIVEAHGGEIGVSSTPGEGSEFWVALPRPEPLPKDGGWSK